MIYSYLKLILTDRTGEVLRPLGGLDWHGCDGWGGDIFLEYYILILLDTRRGCTATAGQQTFDTKSGVDHSSHCEEMAHLKHQHHFSTSPRQHITQCVQLKSSFKM